MQSYCPILDCNWEGTTQGLISHMRQAHGDETVHKAYSPENERKLNPALMIPENEKEANSIPGNSPHAKKLVIQGTKTGGPLMENESTTVQENASKKEYEYECAGCGAEFDKPAKVKGAHYCPECGEELDV